MRENKREWGRTKRKEREGENKRESGGELERKRRIKRVGKN